MKLWADIPGWFECEQGIILQKLCRGKIYLEIGSYKGRSTVCAAEVAKQVYAVDTFKATDNGQDQKEQSTTLDEFLQNTKDYKNIEYFVGESEQIAKKIQDQSLDVIFIDGRHDGDSVIKDKCAWWPKLKNGGYMLFHDYALGCQVKPTVDTLFDSEKIISQKSMALIKKE